LGTEEKTGPIYEKFRGFAPGRGERPGGGPLSRGSCEKRARSPATEGKPTISARPPRGEGKKRHSPPWPNDEKRERRRGMQGRASSQGKKRRREGGECEPVNAFRKSPWTRKRRLRVRKATGRAPRYGGRESPCYGRGGISHPWAPASTGRRVNTSSSGNQRKEIPKYRATGSRWRRLEREKKKSPVSGRGVPPVSRRLKRLPRSPYVGESGNVAREC